MNPSSFNTSVTRSLSLEAGISTFSCSARLAFRIRVRRSAIGSLVMESPLLPARLHHARDLAFERELPEAYAARLELTQVTARPATELAPVVRSHLELRRGLLLHDQRCLGHAS